MNKSDSELDSALLDFFLARIHIDTEAFFKFIKSFLKQKVKELQVKLRNPKSSTQEQANTNSTCVEALIEVKTTNDESNIFNSMEIDISPNSNATNATATATTTITTSNDKSLAAIKDGGSSKVKSALYSSKKVAPVKHIPLQNKFTQLNGIQWQGFNLNYTIQNSLPNTERTAKPSVIELMSSSDAVANSNSLLPDELLARYAYFAALNQIYSSSTYCSPSTSSSFN